MTPDLSPEILVQQGLQALQAGRLDRATALLEQAVRIDPRHVYARHLLGLALMQDGRLDEGMACLERCLALSPADAGITANLTQAYLNRAHDRAAQGRQREALADYDRAATLAPGSLGVHAWRGGLLLDMGRADEALAAYDRTLALSPNLASAHARRANALWSLGRLAEALQAADRALALDSNVAAVHVVRADVVLALGRPEEALADYDWAIQLDPRMAQAFGNRAEALRLLERHAEALDSCRRALKIDPASASALHNRAMVLAELGRYAEAAQDYAAALDLAPDRDETAVGAARVHLVQGAFEQGWPLLERRRRVEAAGGLGELDRPLWTGDADLADKTILLWAEDDLADVVQFCRYAPLVKAMGARVVLVAERPLLGVLETLEGVDARVQTGQPLPDFDLHCPLPSLPLAFGTTLRTIPADIPYLKSDPAKAAAWAQRLGPRQGLRVGLVWAGVSQPGAPAALGPHRRRNIPLAVLAPLNIDGVVFHSLQTGEDAKAELDYLMLSGWAGPAIADHCDALNDLAETAALIDNLDLVIAADTATAHLAGALGKPVWMLNRFDTDWRWLLDRTDSPWYPTARLFRQTRLGEWGDVVQAVGAALEREVGASGYRDQV